LNNAPSPPRDLADALKRIGAHVEHYDNHRLHSAIDHIAPADKLAERAAAILAARDTKLSAARARRKEAARVRKVA